MPLYEFICHGCGKPFEKLIGFSQADQPQVCPACGGQQTQRKLSTFAVGGGSSAQPGLSMRPAASPFT
jgi:putative FmdB family regulatory protein